MQRRELYTLVGSAAILGGLGALAYKSLSPRGPISPDALDTTPLQNPEDISHAGEIPVRIANRLLAALSAAHPNAAHPVRLEGTPVDKRAEYTQLLSEAASIAIALCQARHDTRASIMEGAQFSYLQALSGRFELSPADACFSGSADSAQITLTEQFFDGTSGMDAVSRAIRILHELAHAQQPAIKPSMPFDERTQEPPVDAVSPLVHSQREYEAWGRTVQDCIALQSLTDLPSLPDEVRRRVRSRLVFLENEAALMQSIYGGWAEILSLGEQSPPLPRALTSTLEPWRDKLPLREADWREITLALETSGVAAVPPNNLPLTTALNASQKVLRCFRTAKLTRLHSGVAIETSEHDEQR